MPNIHPFLGVVAIGRNEGERLKRCLRSIPPETPVVYVDSASTDDSVAFVRSTNATVLQLDMAKPFSAARARNEGMALLLEQNPFVRYVQFIDGDCELEAGWLNTAVQFLETQPTIAGVCGRRRERYPDASFYNRMCDDEWNTPIGQADACGGDALMRLAALKQVDGYDSAIIAGEEPELCQRLRRAKWHVWRLDAPMTIHDANMYHFSQYWKRSVRSGFGYAQVFNKTQQGGGDILYQREVVSALVWTIGVMLLASFGAVIFGPIGLLIAPVIWLLQFIRLGRRHGLAHGAHLLIGKVAETLGISRFLFMRARRRDQGAIFYK